MIESGREKPVNILLPFERDRRAMAAGRKEIPPSEQLWGLRHARDHYQALADKLKDDPDFEGTPGEKRERELEARRIAGAYEKSVANMVASCRIRHVDLDPSEPGRAGAHFAILFLFAATAGGAAYFLLPHPDLPRIRILFEPDGGAPVTPKGSEKRAGNPVPLASPQAAAFVRPAGAPAEIAPAIRPTPRPEFAESSGAPDPGGFVAKVLQPDGSLQEEFFKARTAH